MLFLKVACHGQIDCINCRKTKEIICDNESTGFRRETPDRSLQKIKVKGCKITEIFKKY